MIQLDEALALVRSVPASMDSQTVPLREALGRILASPYVARHDQPPFDKSAMDGWVWIPAADETMPPDGLEIRGTIAAGQSAGELSPGQAMRIMTGAALPPCAGADSRAAKTPCRVQRLEWSREAAGRVFFTKPESFDNIIRRAENAAAGAPLLPVKRLRAQDLAVLAADGVATVDVCCRPVVGILSTGTELVEPGKPLGPSQIYDSNRSQVVAQLAGFPCEVRDLGMVSDDFDQTCRYLRDALSQCDVVVLSGGVSMGDFDYVPRALKQLGVEEIFHGVAVKPGKPTFFGRLGTAVNSGAGRLAGGGSADGLTKAAGGARYVFGLPGNPVSVFVNTELLVKPLLAALCAACLEPLAVRAPLAEAISRHSVDRPEFLPVCLEKGHVRALKYGGSSAIQVLSEADGFVLLPAGVATLREGDLADVRLVR